MTGYLPLYFNHYNTYIHMYCSQAAERLTSVLLLKTYFQVHENMLLYVQVHENMLLYDYLYMKTQIYSMHLEFFSKKVILNLLQPYISA